MEKKLTIQAVTGAIRATKGIITSSKSTHAGSTRIRSIGAYAEVRRFSKEIVLDYWTAGYKHERQNAEMTMQKVIATLEERGFKVIRKQEPGWYGSTTAREVLVVELA
jgi:hypothetical protein